MNKLTNKYNKLNPIELIKEAKKKVLLNDIKEIEEPFLIIKKVFNNKNKNEALKIQFEDLEKIYLKKKKSHLKDIEDKLNKNLKLKEEIISNIKSVLNSQDRFAIKIKKIKELQENWKQIGSVKKEHDYQLWKTYKHYLNKFYNYVALSREAMSIDYKKNYEYKTDLIEELKKILEDEFDIEKIIYTHKSIIKRWNLIGNANDEKKLQEEFENINQLINKKKEKYSKEILSNIDEQVSKISYKIEQLKKDKDKKFLYKNINVHINECEYLLKEYNLISKKHIISKEKKYRDIENSFRESKNFFFKSLKEYYKNNLDKKSSLLEELKKTIEEDKDIIKTSDSIKNLQSQWKNIGPCIGKKEKELWTSFQKQCNDFFEKLKLHFKDKEKVMKENLKTKQKLFETIKEKEVKDEKEINEIIEKWSSIGSVQHKDINIETLFKKLIDSFYEKLSLSPVDIEFKKFKTKIDLISKNNSNKLDYELKNISKDRDNLKREINKLETNISFFTISKNSKNTDFINNIKNNIQKMKGQLIDLEKKLSYVRSKKVNT